MSPKTPPAKWQLWHSRIGIQFASQRVHYPELDVSAFVHSTSAEAAANEPGHSSTVRPNYVAGYSRQSTSGGGPGVGCETSSPTPASEKEAAVEKDQREDFPPYGPSFTTLDYKIPEEAFRAASHAAPGNPESFWSYTLYRGPCEDGSGNAKVKVHYCRSRHTTERVCQYFLKEKIVGFDLEWMPDATRWQGARRNVCLVQLASQSRIALFHLSLYPKNDDLVAPSFKKIMEDPEITKAGVWIKGDCTRLKNYLGIQSRGTFELSHLYKLVKHSATGDFQSINKRLVSLATHVHECLGLPMFKGQDVRASDWSQPLRMDQIIYSASDAYAAVQLFNVLEQKRLALHPTPPRPQHAELNIPIVHAAGVNIPDPEESADDARIKWEDKVPTTLSQDFVNSAVEDIKIEAESDTTPETVPKTPRPRKTAVAATPVKPKDQRILEAEKWLTVYRTANTKARSAPAALRAYRIWRENNDLDPVAIAKLLREPPLQTSTVVSYILETIKLDRLPYNKVRLRNEVLDLLPKEILEMRYRTLVKECSDVQCTDQGGEG